MSRRLDGVLEGFGKVLTVFDMNKVTQLYFNGEERAILQQTLGTWDDLPVNPKARRPFLMLWI